VAGAVVAEEAGPSVRFLRWCGMALVVASLLIVIATLLHPSRETAATIIASEVGLIAAHALRRLGTMVLTGPGR
jgi:putative flippase GtrA